MRTKYLDVTTSRAFAVRSFIPVFVDPCKYQDDHHDHDQDKDHHHDKYHHHDHHRGNHKDYHQLDHLPLDGAPGGIGEMSKCESTFQCKPRLFPVKIIIMMIMMIMMTMMTMMKHTFPIQASPRRVFELSYCSSLSGLPLSLVGLLRVAMIPETSSSLSSTSFYWSMINDHEEYYNDSPSPSLQSVLWRPCWFVPVQPGNTIIMFWLLLILVVVIADPCCCCFWWSVFICCCSKWSWTNTMAFD